jgi:hypothetical protein
MTAAEFNVLSQLRLIEHCRSLTSIRIPSGVKRTGDGCFDGSVRFSSVIFESDSHFRGISSSAFRRASSRDSIELPSWTEIVWLGSVGRELARARSSMQLLTFASTRRLVELSLSFPID